MHYRTITLKRDTPCAHCARTIPAGSDALELREPGSRQRRGVSHINDCVRFTPVLKRYGRRGA